MKKLIINAMALAFFATSMSMTSNAMATEVSLPVSINQVGKMKFLVSAEPNSKLVVIIYDADQNIIHQEAIASKKLYNFANLLDGKYRMEILNANKQIIPWAPTFRNLDPNYPLFPKEYFSGGAGLSSTAFDYAIFLQMLLNGGVYNGKQLLGRRTVEVMLSPQYEITNSEKDLFSLGFSLTSKKSSFLGMRSEGSFSWGGYYGTTYWADPKEKIIVLIMTQHSPNSHGDLAQKIENIIYGSLKK